jgi:hypothetical protein
MDKHSDSIRSKTGSALLFRVGSWPGKDTLKIRCRFLDRPVSLANSEMAELIASLTRFEQSRLSLLQSDGIVYSGILGTDDS